MRGAAALLVLLFCLSGSWASDISNQTGTGPNIWAELRALRHMVVKQRLELTAAKTELQCLKDKVADLKTEKAALASWLTDPEKEVSPSMTNLHFLKNMWETAQKEKSDKPKVAFSVVWTNSGTGTDQTVITNVGQAFNPTRGIFTAPVRGVYYFRYTAFDTRPGQSVEVWLVHNNERLMRSTDINDAVDGRVNMSNGLTLLLEVGETVYINSGLYDNANRTTFSGFLLFTM